MAKSDGVAGKRGAIFHAVCFWTFAGLLATFDARAEERSPVKARATASFALKVNEFDSTPLLVQGARSPAVARAQILLDRTHFSIGEIDGSFGENMRKAVVALQRSKGLTPSGRIDNPTWEVLRGGAPVLKSYVVTDKDTAGPFVKIPADLMERSQLPALGYENALEALAERFHASPRLLRDLNPGKGIKAGNELVVPNVAMPEPAVKATTVAIDRSDRTLQVLDREGRVLAQFPISIGGPRDPLPAGSYKLTNEVRDPAFYYDPKLMWDAKAHHEKTKIAPGPNNPVGVVWFGLSKPHYGIHGTPEPSKIGRMETHGCIHLTNWDALKLSSMASAGLTLTVRD